MRIHKLKKCGRQKKLLDQCQNTLIQKSWSIFTFSEVKLSYVQSSYHHTFGNTEQKWKPTFGQHNVREDPPSPGPHFSSPPTMSDTFSADSLTIGCFKAGCSESARGSAFDWSLDECRSRVIGRMPAGAGPWLNGGSFCRQVLNGPPSMPCRNTTSASIRGALK